MHLILSCTTCFVWGGGSNKPVQHLDSFDVELYAVLIKNEFRPCISETSNTFSNKEGTIVIVCFFLVYIFFFV